VSFTVGIGVDHLRLFEYKFIVSSPSEYQNIVNKPLSIHTPSDKILGMMQFNQVQHSIGSGRKSLDQATSKPNLLSPRAHTCCQQCIRRVLHRICNTLQFQPGLCTWRQNVHLSTSISQMRLPQNPYGFCLKIRPHRFGGEGVLIGGQQQHYDIC